MKNLLFSLSKAIATSWFIYFVCQSIETNKSNPLKLACNYFVFVVFVGFLISIFFEFYKKIKS